MKQEPLKSLSERLRESRAKHPLKNYDDAVKQLRVFRAVIPVTKSVRTESSCNRRPQS